jgi:hypothetical protein
MQGPGIMPSAVEDAIANGALCPMPWKDRLLQRRESLSAATKESDVTVIITS